MLLARLIQFRLLWMLTKSVTATFTQDQYALTVNVVGSGSVAKVPDQATYASGDCCFI